MRKEHVEILTDSKNIIYEVEIPTTLEEFGNGLAYRDNILKGTGMLYDYHTNPGEVHMYTPDTRVPVDFIFIDQGGQIIKISTAKPLSKELHTSQNTSWVLEINGGEAAEKGIQIGDTVRNHLLGNNTAYCMDFPSDVLSCRRYGPQVFIKTKSTEFMYSFGVHDFIDIRADENTSNNFDLKLKSYAQQHITAFSMTEQEAKEHIKDCEKKFKEDFRQTKSEFFIWNNECVIKRVPVENRIYLYIFGNGWEEIEWWDDRKERFMIGVYLAGMRITSKQVEEVITKIEADKKKISEVNNRNAQFVNRPNFGGEHFEGLGNMWEAVGVENMQEYIQQLSKKATYLIKNDTPLSENDRLFMQYMQIIYRDCGVVLGFAPQLNEDIQIALLVKEGDKCLEFLSAYPFMRGFPNEVTIEGYHTWESGIEGVFMAGFHDMTSVTWFDPFYLYTKNAQPLHKKAEIMFSGLALKLEKTKSKVMTVHHGGLFQLRLEEFLKNHPNKTAAAMPPVKIELGKATLFLPTSYATEYEYQAKINHVKTCRLGDKKVYQLEAIVLRDPEKDSAFTLNLYAFEHVLNGYKPKKGNFVHGILWLTGYHHMLTDKK